MARGEQDGGSLPVAHRLARLEAEAHARAAHDAAFRTVSEAIRDETDPHAIAVAAAAMLRQHLGVTEATLVEIAVTGPAVVTLHRADRAVPTGFRLPRAFDTMLTVLGKGGIVRHGNLARALPDAAGLLRRRGIGALLAAPVVIDGRLVAALLLSHAVSRPWSDEDVRLVENLAERGWSAMTRARVVAASAERERGNRFLLDWSDAVRGRMDLDAIVDLTLAQLARHIGTRAATYAEIDAAGGRIGAVRRWQDGEATGYDSGMAVTAFGRTIVDRARDTTAASVEDVATDPRLDEAERGFHRAAGRRAFLLVPLVDETAIGMLAVDEAVPRAWTQTEATLVRDVGNRLSAILTHVRAERRRAESEALLSAFMERAPLGMHVKDAAGRYISANPELAFALGQPREVLLGRRPAEVMPTAIAARLEAIDAEARGGATVSAELADPSRDHHHTMLAVAFPITGAGAAATGGFTIDLSERVAAEAELERSRDALHQSEKLSALGSLLAGVSHELNNPLSIVTAQADLIEHLAEGGPIAARAAKLRAAADRCARIVRTFLAMARRQDPVRRSVAIGEVVEAALALVGYGLAVDGIVVDCHLAPDLPAIDADPDQLHQIVVNLLVNAQHALADTPGRRIAVTTRQEGSRIVLEVADNGPGVPEEARRRIFDPFFTTKPQGQGTGMGLAFSQGLAEAHGGTLALVPGERGATFRLLLPTGATRPETAEAAPAVRPIGRGRTALVVDDQRGDGEALAQLLVNEGFQVRVVENGSAAQALLGTRRFDLVVTAMRMPGVDGPGLWRWLQRLRPDLMRAMVFTTDDVGPRTTVFLREAGRPWLEKPVAAAALREMLAGLVRDGALS